MEFFVALATMITVVLLAYGLLYRPLGEDLVGGRLGGLKYRGPSQREALPDPEAGFKLRVLKPLGNAIGGRFNRILPSNMVERLETALSRSGTKVTPSKFMVGCALSAGLLPLLMLALLVSKGTAGKDLLLLYGGVQVVGVMMPRVWLTGRVKRRQKAIQKSLPDAFDLVTASVEAGLGIDAAFSRILEKVEGPFAEELSRTMREINMGRARRDALSDLSDRTGVEELRSLVNAVIQAESMGISIGGVIRVQTGVMRMKRRQRAEEQAFKAPVKMVFPLVLFIFPCIMIVIGGPAVIQLMRAI